jgi:LacI family transcriptional regulator
MTLNSLGGDRRPTMRDIAALAGVSQGTVSRVLNGRPGVGDDTRARIEQLIASEGFQANASAQWLSTGRSRSIGIVFPFHTSEVVLHPIYPALLGALGDAAEAANYDVMLLNVASPDKVSRLLDVVSRRRVDGVVLPASGAHDPLIRELLSLGTPVVVIGHRVRAAGVGWVDCSHDVAALELTQFLIRSGRKRLTLLNGPSTVSACRLRASGFWKAVKEAGSELESAEEHEVAFGAEASAEAATEALSRSHDRPDAIIAGNDLIASGCLDAARVLGLDVPADVAVSGFDDRSLAAHTSPALTTVRMPLQQIGQAAAEMLFAMIEGQQLTKRHIVLPTEIVWRDSTPAAAAEPV